MDIAIETEDLGRVRFVSDPLWEAASSLFALVCPESRAVHRRLAGLIEGQRVDGMDLLRELCGDTLWVPDMLTLEPDPAVLDDPEAALARVAEVPDDVVDADLAVLRARPAPGPASRMGRDELRERTAQALLVYWRGVLAPLWPRARLVALDDIRTRSQRVVSDGLGPALDGLHERITYADGTLNLACASPHETFAARGGLWLVPSVFRWPGFAVQYETPRPVVCYPAAGAGRVWEGGNAESAALVRLLGRTRADVLGRSGLPTSTTELAAELGMAKGTVSEHLAALTDAGLLEPTRHGRRVLYARTELGDSLSAVG